MKKIFKLLIALTCISLLTACGSTSNSKTTFAIKEKGTVDNPYTLNDTVTVSTTSWKGHRLLDGDVEGTSTFELSNFRIERLTFNRYDDLTTDVLVFDSKCIETSLENGVSHTFIGDYDVENFFNSNKQILNFSEVTTDYTDLNSLKMTYFEGTTYTLAYALCDVYSSSGIVHSDEYSMMRIRVYDENLEEDYVYISLK